MKVQFVVAVMPPHRGEDLVAHLAFQRGWTLSGYTTTRFRRGHMFTIHLGDVPETVSPEERDDFSEEVQRALKLIRGMPWLSVRDVIAYMKAERQVEQVGDPQASEMFALLRQTDREGWDEILRPLYEHTAAYRDHAGKQVVGTAAVAALKALAGLVGIPLT